MKIYPHLILWTYVLLPAICLIFSPTLLLSLAKAQQQRAKLMANALNVKARAAAALARNQFKNRQRMLNPSSSSRLSNGFVQNPYRFRATRDVKTPMVGGRFIGENPGNKNHWDQQEESMGMLQNMWNMNGFANAQNTDTVRNVRTERAELDGSTGRYQRVHAAKNGQQISNPYSGAFFRGRNVYDALVGQADPAQNDFDENMNEDNEFNEDVDEDDQPLDLAESRNHHWKKPKKNKNYFGEYHYYPYEYYRNNNGEAQFTPLQNDQELWPQQRIKENIAELVQSPQNQQFYNPEDVGCEQDDEIFKTMGLYNNNLDPAGYYKKTVDQVEALNKELSEPAKKLTKPLSYPDHDLFKQQDFEINPEASFIDSKELPNHYPVNEAVTSLEAKSADPHLGHHSRGFVHTLSHVHSHKLIDAPSHQGPVYLQPSAGLSEASAFANTNAYNRGFQNGYSHLNGGFGQPPAITNSGYGHLNEHLSPVSLNSGGFGQSTASAQAIAQNTNAGFGQSSAQAQAVSQSVNTGFGGSSAAAQAAAGVKGNPQFFQLLGPSSFVNARTNNEALEQPPTENRFNMPQTEEVPANNLLHEIKSQIGRARRSTDTPSGAFSGLNLASDIIHSVLDKNPQLVFDRNLLKSSSKAGEDKFETDNDDEDKTADSLEKAKDITFKGISSITDIVNGGLRHKKEVVKESEDGKNNTATDAETFTQEKDFPQSELKSNLLGFATISKPDSQEIFQNIESTTAKLFNESTEQNLNQQTTETNDVNMSTQNENSEFDYNDEEDDFRKMSLNHHPLLTMTPRPDLFEKNKLIEDNVSESDFFTTANSIVGTPLKLETTESDVANKNTEKATEINEKKPEYNTEVDENSIVESENSKTITKKTPKETVNNEKTNNLAQKLNQQNEANETAPKIVESQTEETEEDKATEKYEDNLVGIKHNENKSSEESSEEDVSGVGTTEKYIGNKISPIINQPITTTIQPVIVTQEISSLSDDEIEDIQFSIPDSAEQTTTSFPLTENDDASFTTTEPIILSNSSQDVTVNSSDIQDFTETPKTESFKNSRFDHFKRKILLNESANPFGSMESEMGILTEEERDAFIRQEMELIAEIIEEGLKSDPLPSLLDNKAKVASKDDINDTVSFPNIMQVPEFNDFEKNHERYAYKRSVKPDEAFDVILGAQKEKVDNIQQEATDDGDLLMISFIGDGIIKDLEKRRNKAEENKTSNTITAANRAKRDLTNIQPTLVPLAPIDPASKIDISKTLENVGSVVRNSFESPKAPMYHVRNMIGNTKNTIMSAIKIPPNNVLVPSQYEVAKLSRKDDPTLGAINQKMLFSRIGENGSPTKENSDSVGIIDTFQKLGGIVKQSIDTGKNVVSHANDAASDARNVVYTASNTVPQLIIPGKVPLIVTRAAIPNVSPFVNKPVLITPKLIDLQQNVLGAEQEQSHQFIGIGHILDDVGLSNPYAKEVGLQQIILDPAAINSLAQLGKSRQIGEESPEDTQMGSPPSTKDHLLGVKQTSESLNEAEKSVGAKSLKDFFNKMHQEMKEILTSQHEERKRKLNDRKVKLQTNQNRKKGPKRSKKKPKTKARDSDKKAFEDVGVVNYDKIIDANIDVTLPPEILGIFADASSKPKLEEKLNSKNLDSRMPEITQNNIDEIHPGDHQQNKSISTNNEDPEVGLYLSPELLKPFMGQPSENQFNDFMRENGDEAFSDRRSSDISAQKKLIEPLNLNIPSKPSIINDLISPQSTTDGSNVQDVSKAAELNTTENISNVSIQDHPLNEMRRSEDIGHLLGAINPLMFERKFNESIKRRAEVANKSRKSLFADQTNDDRTLSQTEKRSENNNEKQEVANEQSKINSSEQLELIQLKTANMTDLLSQTPPSDIDKSDITERTSMIINDRYQKPFLGIFGHDKINDFLDQYNNDLSEDAENFENVKNVVFSDEEKDFNYLM